MPNAESLNLFLRNSGWKIVGVTGNAGAGKTTLAERIGISTIHVDDFFIGSSNDRKKLAKEKESSIDSLIDFYNMASWWNWDSLETAVVKAKASNKDVVLVEGALLGTPPIVELMDKILFLYTPREQRLSRLLRRDFLKRGPVEAINRFLITEYSEASHYKFLMERYADKLIFLDNDYNFTSVNEEEIAPKIQYLPISVKI